jgi:predicted MFS family arabinose efflux permease
MLQAKIDPERPGPEPMSAPNATELLGSSHTGLFYALALGTFAVGTEGFMIAAILPSISHSLDVTVREAGLLVSVFSFAYAVSSPVLTVLTGTLARRTLLLASLGAFILSNLVAAIVPGFGSLVAARILIAFAAGLFVPNANAIAGALAHPARRGRALAIVNGGITVAVAVGVPLGSVVGANFGWRATFIGVALISAIALATIAWMLPLNLQLNPPATLRERLTILVHRPSLTVLVTTALWAIGAYTVYTYLSPFLSAAAGLSQEGAGLVLALLGSSALVGVTLGGAANDRYGARKAQAVALPLMAVAFSLLTLCALMFSPNALPYILPLVVLWGLSAWGFFPPQQARLIAVAGVANASVALSLNASFMYLGFAIGGLVGAIVLGVASAAWIGLAGAIVIVFSMAVSRLGWLQTQSGGPGGQGR